MADDEKPKETPAEYTPPRANDRKDVNAVVQRLVTKYGSADAALAVLADENLDWRRDNEQLRAKVPEGAKVLTGKDAAAYDAWLALGKSPKEISDVIAQNATLSTENTDLRAEKTSRDAAKAIGSDKPAVLAKILKAEGYRLEVKDEKDGDEVKQVAYAVKGEGDTVESTELSALLAGTLSDYRPALLTEQPTTNTRPTAALPSQPPKGTAPAPKDRSVDQIKEEKRATGAYSA